MNALTIVVSLLALGALVFVGMCLVVLHDVDVRAGVGGRDTDGWR